MKITRDGEKHTLDGQGTLQIYRSDYAIEISDGVENFIIKDFHLVSTNIGKLKVIWNVIKFLWKKGIYK